MVTVNYLDKTEQYVWEGDNIYISLPANVTYSIRVSDTANYLTPEEYTGTVLRGVDQSVELTYNRNSVRIKMSSNQEKQLDEATAVLTYSGNAITVSNGQEVQLPSEVECTVVFNDVDGYKTPEDVTFVFDHTMEIEGIYKAEMVTVNVYSQTPGYSVTINAHKPIAGIYTPLKYIESTGSQYIDTGFVPNQDTRVVVKVETQFSSYNWLFGARYSKVSRSFGFAAGTDGVYTSTYNNEQQTIDSSFNKEGAFVLDKNKNLTYIDGELAYTHEYATFESPRSMYLFAIYTTSTAAFYYSTAKIYYCQIYDNDVLVRDYVPCVREDGIAGLYDKLNGTFSPSEGSSNFIVGVEDLRTLAVQTSVTGTYLIPWGDSYSIVPSELTDHKTPNVFSRVANVDKTTVSMQYIYAPDEGITNPTNGVWIQGANNKFYTKDNYLGMPCDVNGIAVITDEHSFVVGLYDIGSYKLIDIYTHESLCITTDVNVAYEDFNGKGNTLSMIPSLTGDPHKTAAYYCRKYTFPNGNEGYLPALGEMCLLADNVEKVEELITLVGTSIKACTDLYWTSTMYDSDTGYANMLTVAGYSLVSGGQAYPVRPFTTI